ncbi:phosphotransferase family protein [Rhizorhabdus argentea]|uniref:phosphotransferase family protein n=1 Tax=Rhizorhabdus argentea TaxID=1387174 RepID=UPI0030EEE2BB
MTKSLREYLVRQLAGNVGYGSNEEAALAAARLLEDWSEESGERDRACYDELEGLLVDVAQSLNIELAPEIAKIGDDLVRSIRNLDFDRRRDLVEQGECALLTRLSEFSSALSAEPSLDPAGRQGAALAIAAWDCRRIGTRAGRDSRVSANEDRSITAPKLEIYLRNHFSDPDLTLRDFASIAGGFGKETIIFAASGRELTGEFVLRRDRSSPILDNDCHRVSQEFPVLCAVASRGFPAPDALWVDIEHRLLPGGDFLVMRRSPGATCGDIFGGPNALSAAIQQNWAEAVADLHTLPQLKELGDLTNSIRTELWDMPLQEVSRCYIRDYYDHYLANSPAPLPSLAALYAWLLPNVPDAGMGRPALVHGDLGLQNLLLDGDRLSAVLDWEMAHIGDPLEDLAYIRNTASNNIDWDYFLKIYEERTGRTVAPAHLHFYRVWGHVRNATAAAIGSDRYSNGALEDFNIAPMGFFYVPRFLDEAIRLIEAGPTS